MTEVFTETMELNNNESLIRGVWKNPDGTFLAMTYTRSKEFKTLRGAQRWYSKATGQA